MAPDSAAQGGYLTKYESATCEMVVWAVFTQPVSASNSLKTGNLQGNFDFCPLILGALITNGWIAAIFKDDSRLLLQGIFLWLAGIFIQRAATSTPAASTHKVGYFTSY